MKSLLKTLAALADQLDQIDSPEFADEVDNLAKGLPFSVIEPSVVEELEFQDREHDAAKLMGDMETCPACLGKGYSEDSPWCEVCKGEGKVSLNELHNYLKGFGSKKAELEKNSYIRHEGGKWNVYSRKGKRLGSYKTKGEAQKRLRAIEFFKHNK